MPWLHAYNWSTMISARPVLTPHDSQHLYLLKRQRSVDCVRALSSVVDVCGTVVNILDLIILLFIAVGHQSPLLVETLSERLVKHHFDQCFSSISKYCSSLALAAFAHGKLVLLEHVEIPFTRMCLNQRRLNSLLSSQPIFQSVQRSYLERSRYTFCARIHLSQDLYWLCSLCSLASSHLRFCERSLRSLRVSLRTYAAKPQHISKNPQQVLKGMCIRQRQDASFPRSHIYRSDSSKYRGAYLLLLARYVLQLASALPPLEKRLKVRIGLYFSAIDSQQSTQLLEHVGYVLQDQDWKHSATHINV